MNEDILLAEILCGAITFI